MIYSITLNVYPVDVSSMEWSASYTKRTDRRATPAKQFSHFSQRRTGAPKRGNSESEVAWQS